MRGRTQTVQATSKRWKGLQALGCFGALVGLSSLTVGFAMTDVHSKHMPTNAAITWGFALLFGGLTIRVFARVGAWWFHG